MFSNININLSNTNTGASAPCAPISENNSLVEKPEIAAVKVVEKTEQVKNKLLTWLITEHGANPEHAEMWLRARGKKDPLTAKAFSVIEEQAKIAGLTIAQVVDCCATANFSGKSPWIGFNAEWVNKNRPRATQAEAVDNKHTASSAEEIRRCAEQNFYRKRSADAIAAHQAKQNPQEKAA